MVSWEFGTSPMSTPDFFRSRLDAMIDLRHPLAVLATRCCVRAATTCAGCCARSSAWASALYFLFSRACVAGSTSCHNLCSCGADPAEDARSDRFRLRCRWAPSSQIEFFRCDYVQCVTQHDGRNRQASRRRCLPLRLISTSRAVLLASFTRDFIPI